MPHGYSHMPCNFWRENKMKGENFRWNRISLKQQRTNEAFIGENKLKDDIQSCENIKRTSSEQLMKFKSFELDSIVS